MEAVCDGDPKRVSFVVRRVDVVRRVEKREKIFFSNRQLRQEGD